MLKISYDKEGDILEIKFSDDPVEESEYVGELGLVVDFAKDRTIVAIEITSFSKRVKKDQTLEVLTA